MDLKEVVMITTLTAKADTFTYKGEWRVVKLDQRKREVELTNGGITIWQKFDEINAITIKDSEVLSHEIK